MEEGKHLFGGDLELETGDRKGNVGAVVLGIRHFVYLAPQGLMRSDRRLTLQSQYDGSSSCEMARRWCWAESSFVFGGLSGFDVHKLVNKRSIKSIKVL